VIDSRHDKTRRVAQSKAIDLLNVDAEGWDHVVLESNDWETYRPEIIAVESHGFNLNCPSENRTLQFLTSKGYSLNSHVIATSVYMRK
jgi:hypothetical protein